MKKRLLSGLAIIVLATVSFTACGGGGGGGGDNTPVQATKAVLKLMTSGTGTTIYGIDVTVNLPSGVTVKATPDSENPSVYVTDAGVVTASGGAAGANATVLAAYTAASGATPGKVVVNIANADGFGTGEFATVNCDVAAGSHPTAADFSVSGLYAADLNGAAITLTAGFTADIK